MTSYIQQLVNTTKKELDKRAISHNLGRMKLGFIEKTNDLQRQLAVNESQLEAHYAQIAHGERSAVDYNFVLNLITDSRELKQALADWRAEYSRVFGEDVPEYAFDLDISDDKDEA